MFKQPLLIEQKNKKPEYLNLFNCPFMLIQKSEIIEMINVVFDDTQQLERTKGAKNFLLFSLKFRKDLITFTIKITL